MVMAVDWYGCAIVIEIHRKSGDYHKLIFQAYHHTFISHYAERRLLILRS